MTYHNDQFFGCTIVSLTTFNQSNKIPSHPIALQYVRCPISTLCVGQAASMATLLLAAGDAGERRSLPNARMMIHQPSGGASGQASDIAIHAQEIIETRSRLNALYSRHTGKPLDIIGEYPILPTGLLQQNYMSLLSNTTTLSQMIISRLSSSFSDTLRHVICPECAIAICASTPYLVFLVLQRSPWKGTSSCPHTKHATLVLLMKLLNIDLHLETKNLLIKLELYICL